MARNRRNRGDGDQEIQTSLIEDDNEEKSEQSPSSQQTSPNEQKIDKTTLPRDAETEQEFRNRVYSVVSYIIVLLVIGIPVWWVTTRVYRAHLPSEEMLNVEVPPKIVRENALPLSLEYDVLITIANPDPANLKLELDGHDLDVNLQPFLHTLQPIANFTVKSQWLYLTPLKVTPVEVEDIFVIPEDELPYLITPLETKIWSHMSSRPCLNLIVYTPKCATAPLQIYDKTKKVVESNSFLSPRWGGIQILPVTKKDCENGVYKPDLKRVVSIFLHQLKDLIGLHGDSPEDILELKRTKVKEMIDSTRRTLKSLAMLLQEINSIVISDEVANKVKIALEHANQADEYMKREEINKALHSAQIAFEHSEKAFSDPSLLALLYFPDDQKYAVYIPLFLPIMIPVLMSCATLYRKIQKNRKEKLA